MQSSTPPNSKTEMKKIQVITNKAQRYGIQIVAVGAITGTFAGLVVSLYTIVAEMTEQFARGYFGFFRDNPAFIPLLFLALFLGSIVIGGVLRFLPAVRGSGFAQAEGASRGLMHFRWYRELTGMFASSLFLLFAGLSAGVEGPGVFIGGMCGYGASEITRRDPVVRRYQVTGGACAGLAVAMNAPLTGIIFAYEEAHKRFTPEVFVCSFTSVVFAVLVRNLLLPAMHIEIGPFLGGFALFDDPGLFFCLFALAAALVVSLVGVAFYHLVFLCRKLLRRIKPWHGVGKYAIVFAVAGAFGLIAAESIGGGATFIRAISSSGGGVELFGAPLWAAVLVVVAFKFMATALNVGAELPCCASVPMMAVGAGVGKLMAELFIKTGMDPMFADGLVVLGMTTMFTTVVKAPVTGIIMTLELTWSFSFLLPAVLSSAVAYIVGDVLHTEALYEKLLDDMLEERASEAVKVTAKLSVQRAAGRAIRDILWPFSAIVTEITRGDKKIRANGGTVLLAGDVITVEGTPEDSGEFLSELSSTVGKAIFISETPLDKVEKNGIAIKPDKGDKVDKADKDKGEGDKKEKDKDEDPDEGES